MTIDELIEELNEIKLKHGGKIKVNVWDCGPSSDPITDVKYYEATNTALDGYTEAEVIIY